MKKFDRLSPDQRKAEIREAALTLFGEKGFSATTMENIVDRVSLSKGGVYRLYPSTTAILSDLMIEGMRLRNAFYAEQVRKETASGKKLTLSFLVEMIGDSLLLYPEISAVYVEFLWEKRHHAALEDLYQEICREAVEETAVLIRQYGAEELLLSDPNLLGRLTELMNAAVLSLHVLDVKDLHTDRRKQLCSMITRLLTEKI